MQVVPSYAIPEPRRAELTEARAGFGILQECTLVDFIQTIHPKVGLRIEEIMVIWGELALLALQLRDMIEEVNSENDPVLLRTLLEARFNRQEIVTALQKCVALSKDCAAECLDFLCFTPARGVTLWDHPILRAGNDVCLLSWPLLGAYHARLLSAWARADATLKKEFEKKGTYNEKFIVSVLRHAIAEGPYGDAIRFIGNSLNPRQKLDEEIDILITVGDTAFVIELASIPSPAEAFEFDETERRLEQKARQCMKQCEALRNDLAQVAVWAGDISTQQPIDKVVGLVLTNSYLRDGLYESEICHCHWETLANILHYGGMYFGLLRGEEEYTLKAPISPATGSTLAVTLIAALRRSPKAEFYATTLKHTDLNLPGLDETDIPGIYRALHCEYPSPPELFACLKACSFGAMLEETQTPEFD